LEEISVKPILKLTAVEAKLFLREPVSLFVVFALPLGLMLVFGLPQRGAPTPPPAGQHGEPAFLSIGMLALFTLPMALGIYRERGILRRLATTPARPVMLLVAQVLINLVMAAVGTAGIVAGARYALHIGPPANLPLFAVALALGIACLFTIGLVIAALAPNARAAQSIGPALFFPLLFLAGAWVPREQLPAALAAIGTYSPLGATVDTLGDAWQGTTPHVAQLAAMLVFAALGGFVATRYFRWQ
jgi:ABC-2 type transport system permease protein